MASHDPKRRPRLTALVLGSIAWCAPYSAAHATPPQGDSERGSPHAVVVEPEAANEPSEAVQAEYRSLVAKAVGEFGAGRWAEARALFLRGHQLWPSARTFRSLGMCSFELRTYARALSELQAAGTDPRRPLSPEHQAQVAALIEQTRAFVGVYRVSLSPPTTKIVVDGVARTIEPDGLLVLDVGSHALSAGSDGYDALHLNLDVQGHEDQPLALELQPVAAAPQTVGSEPISEPRTKISPVRSERPTPREQESRGRVWTWVAGGAAVALGVASEVLWLQSNAEFAPLNKKCDAEVCVKGKTDESSFTDLETAHHVTLALALTAGVGAITLFFLEPDSDEAEPAHVSVGLGTLHLRGNF